MKKAKRVSAISIRDRLLQAKPFDHTVFTKPRNFTRHMTSIVRYPEKIYDIGRTVDVRRNTEQSFRFEIRQKRYLGRGSFTISSRAKGTITYNPQEDKTRITGFVCLGGQYVVLLTIMTLIVLLSSALMFVTILFVPLALLMSAVISLHWLYLFADRADVQTQLAYLVDVTDRELRLQDPLTEQSSNYAEPIGHKTTYTNDR